MRGNIDRNKSTVTQPTDIALWSIEGLIVKTDFTQLITEFLETPMISRFIIVWANTAEISILLVCFCLPLHRWRNFVRTMHWSREKIVRALIRFRELCRSGSMNSYTRHNMQDSNRQQEQECRMPSRRNLSHDCIWVVEGTSCVTAVWVSHHVRNRRWMQNVRVRPLKEEEEEYRRNYIKPTNLIPYTHKKLSRILIIKYMIHNTIQSGFVTCCMEWHKKVKQSLYRPGVAQRAPGS
jgi:hypothetical protein